MTAQTNIYHTEKMKTFRTKMQFSQQLNELGIKVGDVLKSDFRFIKLIKKKDSFQPKNGRKLAQFLTIIAYLLRTGGVVRENK